MPPPVALSEGARWFWKSLTRLKRASGKNDHGAALETEARQAAAKLLGLEPLRWHNIRPPRRRRHRGPRVDFAEAAAELQDAGLVAVGGAPSAATIRRACPSCGAAVRWLVTRSGMEVPWCQKCGPLRFWLVFTRGAPSGFGGFGGASLW